MLIRIFSTARRTTYYIVHLALFHVPNDAFSDRRLLEAGLSPTLSYVSVVAKPCYTGGTVSAMACNLSKGSRQSFGTRTAARNLMCPPSSFISRFFFHVPTWLLRDCRQQGRDSS